MIGKQTRKARLDKGMSQAEVAKRIGTSQTYVSMFERGEAEPGEGWLVALSRVLGRDFLNGDSREAGCDWLAARLEDVTGVASGFWLDAAQSNRPNV